MKLLSKIHASLLAGALFTASLAYSAEPARVYDIATRDAAAGQILRLHGYRGLGTRGLPLAGGADIDGDGHNDLALAMMTANPRGLNNAGEIAVLFSNGTAGGVFDSGAPNPNILHIEGAQIRESIGNEVWIDDVTGDGLAEILICRQNFTPDGTRIGAGAFSIMGGGEALRDLAKDFTPINLAAPPAHIPIVTFVGKAAYDRMGIWSRTADVDGDGIKDILVGADQADCTGGQRCGEVYLIRGGDHLATSTTIDLINFGSTALADQIIRITPPSNSAEYHFGATNYLADIDLNGRAEIIIAAALNRAGAGITPEMGAIGETRASGGSPDGTVYILWDDNIPPGPWTPGTVINFPTSPGSRTIVDGAVAENSIFGEELAAGVDFDNNGLVDLFIGDFAAPNSNIGTGYVFYDFAQYKNQTIDLDNPPAGLRITRIVGPNAAAISSDTAIIGDYNGDSIGDLAIGSPHANPLNRTTAGTVHVIFGQTGGWPANINLAPGQLPDPSLVTIVEIRGALGTVGSDRGDTLAYSAVTGDIDGDCFDDLIINEMVGNGLQPNTVDVGNLLVIRGIDVSTPGTECQEAWWIVQ